MTNEELARFLIHANPAFHDLSISQIIKYLDEHRESEEELMSLNKQS